jgi:ATP-dependent Zn protease
MQKKPVIHSGIRRFLIVAVIITLVLYALKDTSVQKDAAGTPYIEKTIATHEIGLGELLSRYKSGHYTSLHLINDSLLEGYVLSTGTSTQSVQSMTLKKNIAIKEYILETSQKPDSSSLTDLGISLTGETKIVVETRSTSTISRILIDQVLPTVLFFAAILLFFKMFGPKGGAGGMPFNIKVGKLKGKSEVETKFKDVAGMDECKEELVEIVDFLKNPEKYRKA